MKFKSASICLALLIGASSAQQMQQTKICTAKDDAKVGYSQCCPMSKTRTGKQTMLTIIPNVLAYYYYEDSSACSVGSEPLPMPVKGLACDLPCKEGEYLDADLTSATSVCR